MNNIYRYFSSSHWYQVVARARKSDRSGITSRSLNLNTNQPVRNWAPNRDATDGDASGGLGRERAVL